MADRAWEFQGDLDLVSISVNARELGWFYRELAHNVPEVRAEVDAAVEVFGDMLYVEAFDNLSGDADLDTWERRERAKEDRRLRARDRERRQKMRDRHAAQRRRGDTARTQAQYDRILGRHRKQRANFKPLKRQWRDAATASKRRLKRRDRMRLPGERVLNVRTGRLRGALRHKHFAGQMRSEVTNGVFYGALWERGFWHVAWGNPATRTWRQKPWMEPALESIGGDAEFQTLIGNAVERGMRLG